MNSRLDVMARIAATRRNRLSNRKDMPVSPFRTTLNGTVRAQLPDRECLHVWPRATRVIAHWKKTPGTRAECLGRLREGGAEKRQIRSLSRLLSNPSFPPPHR